MEAVTLLLLVGGWGPGELERALDGAHRAAARDLLESLLGTGMIGRAVVATDDPAWGDTLADLPVQLDLDPPEGGAFHFGRRLAGLIERYDARAVLYSGGASAPLLDVERWRQVLARLGEAERLVVTNNLHSCDWVGFVPAGEVLPLVARQGSDNAVAWALAHEGGLPVEDMAATAATRFDLDTPADLLIAARHPGVGPHLRRFLDGLGWAAPQLDGVLAAMAREGDSLAVVGRASAAAWAALERATRCWIRVFAEERGMRASGRQGRGEVRSLLADYLELVGVERFFDELAGLADGVLMDNRVILAARGLWPSASDRFNSDLHRWERVGEPFLRRLTRAAAEARVPVMMGGHAVVAGGLMALVEAFEMGRGGGWVMGTVLIVCTGNLCRSPMAEGLLRARLARDEARRDWRVGSAGVWTVDGRPASENGVREMAQRGIDLSGHRSRSVTREMMDEADLVLAMTRGHAEALTAAFPEHGSKVYLLSEMVGGMYDIEDPYGGTRSEYARTARQLERLIEEGYARIVALVEGTDGG